MQFYVQLLLMDYFSKYLYSRDMVIEIANLKQYDWITCAGIIKTMLWLDVKRFVEKNQDTIDDLVKKRGNGWLTFMPLDITGLLRPNEFIIESLTSMLSNIRAQDIKSEVEKVKTSLTSLQIDYEATDLYISNCIIPLQIPTNDDEWSMFGYSLFWLAKRSRQINIPFTIEQLSKLMEYGDIKSKADAIRGIYEQNYYEFCTVAIKSLLMRITEEFCVLNLIITDDKVKCDFVPPIFDNEQISNVKGNYNHYWKIKVLDIFEQMYSEKEYIEINLIGVDLLKDLGIQAIDHQVCIHKTNRPCVWVTEINSWECYVNQIDEIRRIANQVVVGTISYIEFLYKNQHHSNKRWDKLTADVKNMKQLLFNDVLIPKSAVDPYCIFRENMREDTINANDCVSKTLGLSINTYTVIRESFRDVYRQLECFFDQFSEILLARLKYDSLENIENPRLPLFNLYNSAKALLSLQNEYNALFYDYRTLEDGFETKELEDLLTLVNMFAYVFENPIKGYQLAYDAKQLYRKSKVYIEQAFNKTLSSIGGQSHIIDDKTYLIVDFEPEQENLLENEYVNIILKLRSEYEKALTHNSVRWHLETQVPELIYVPTYNSIPIASGFQMQTYRILDVSENELTKIMFPAELPESLYDILGVSCEELKKWQLGI